MYSVDSYSILLYVRAKEIAERLINRLRYGYSRLDAVSLAIIARETDNGNRPLAFREDVTATCAIYLTHMTDRKDARSLANFLSENTTGMSIPSLTDSPEFAESLITDFKATIKLAEDENYRNKMLGVYNKVIRPKIKEI